MRSSKQPAREKNITAIADYFKSGIKAEGANSIGIELEHTLVKTDGEPVSYSDEFGQKWILKQLENSFPAEMIDDDGDLIGIANDRATVTLEPAGQLELSAGPFTEMNTAKTYFEKFEHELALILNPHGIEALTPGYHPTRRAVDLHLIPKKRYEFMNEYLGAISMFGICMMRGSASTQVSIDYSSVDDCLKKLRIANACVPIFSLMCDNSPIFEELPREHKLVRTEIWEKCDPDRCNTVLGVMDDGFTLEDYARYILDTPAIIDANGKEQILSEKTFGEIFADREMTKSDIEHALSMFFTDVRLKTYIEIRPADAMPVDYAIAYAAMIKGLFYNQQSLDSLDHLFAGVTASDIADAKASLMTEGYSAKVYSSPVSELADEIISLASAGLSERENELLAPLASLVASRTTLADIALG